jgi:hypothetical protein
MTGTAQQVAFAVGIFVGFFVFFVPFWMAIGALITQISGWRRVAARYPAGDVPPEGEHFSNQVTGFGIVSENNVTRVIVSPAGLHLSAIFPFRFRRPPLFVPWDQVRWKSERRFLWVHAQRLDLGGLATVTMKDEGYRAAARYMAGQGPPV